MYFIRSGNRKRSMSLDANGSKENENKKFNNTPDCVAQDQNKSWWNCCKKSMEIISKQEEESKENEKPNGLERFDSSDSTSTVSSSSSSTNSIATLSPSTDILQHQVSVDIIKIITKLFDEVAMKNTKISGLTLNKFSGSNSYKMPSVPLETYLERVVRQINKWITGNEEIEENAVKLKVSESQMKIISNRDDVGKISPGICSLITGICIYERLVRKNRKTFTLLMNNRHRVIATCMIVALKLNEDEPIDNRIAGKMIGVCINEMNQLERNLCQMINYELFVHESEYLDAITKLVNRS